MEDDDRRPPQPSPSPPLDLLVWGEFAVFTRPEAKAERVTYPVPTPSAARGALEAIFWKPEFRYRVREIAVYKPIRYASILRNEVTGRLNPSEPVPFDIAERRTQRHTLALSDVLYRIRADVEVLPGAEKNEAAYRDQFRRRVARGRCFHRPYLGCREFACDFAAPDALDLPDGVAKALARGPIDDSRDLGLMLFDLAFPAGKHGHADAPLFFEATLEKGVLKIDAEHYRLLDALAGGPPPPRPPRTSAADSGEPDEDEEDAP